MTDNTQIQETNNQDTQIQDDKKGEIEQTIKKNVLKEAVKPKAQALGQAIQKDSGNFKDPQQITVGLDRYENKLIKNRKHIL